MDHEEEFVQTLTRELVPGDRNAFRAEARYDPDGDCIEFISRPEDFYAERIDSLVTVYYGRESGEVVGSLIKGVSKLKEKLRKEAPGFFIFIDDGKVQLRHLFMAHVLTTKVDPQSVPGIVYRKIIEAVEETEPDAIQMYAAG